MKRNFLPTDYKKNTYLNLHNIKKNEITLEEYTSAFDHYMIKYDEPEADEHTIACYLCGLQFKIGNVINLQCYWTYDDVYNLLKCTIERRKVQWSRNHVMETSSNNLPDR